MEDDGLLVVYGHSLEASVVSGGSVMKWKCGVCDLEKQSVVDFRRKECRGVGD